MTENGGPFYPGPHHSRIPTAPDHDDLLRRGRPGAPPTAAAATHATQQHFSSGSPFSSHSRDDTSGSAAAAAAGPFAAAAPHGQSPMRDSFSSPRLANPSAPQQRAIGFELARSTNGAISSGTAGGGGSTSRGSSLGPVARPQSGSISTGTGPGQLSSRPTSISSLHGSGSHNSYANLAFGAGPALTGLPSNLGSLAISDEDLLGDLESLNLGGAGSNPSVLARMQHDTAQIQRHPSVRVPSNYAAQSGVHAASVPSGFGLGQLWGNGVTNTSSNLSGANNNGSIYGSSADSTSSYGGGPNQVPVGMSASTSSHLFNRPSHHQYQHQHQHQQHHISSHLVHPSQQLGTGLSSGSPGSDYLRGAAPSSAQHQVGSQSQMFSPHHHSHHSLAHPLSASWSASGQVTPGTSAPPAPGARMHELAERLHRHQQYQVVQSQKQRQGLSRDLGGASWGTSGSPTGLTGLAGSGGGGGGGGIHDLGRSPASTSGLGRRIAPRSGSHTSITRAALMGSMPGGGGAGSDFDAQSAHSESSDWVDDDGTDEGGPGEGSMYGNGSLQHHHPQAHRHHQHAASFSSNGGAGGGVGMSSMGNHSFQGESRRNEYEEGEEGAGGAGARTPTARTSRHPLGGFTTLSGISAAVQQQQQQRQHEQDHQAQQARMQQHQQQQQSTSSLGLGRPSAEVSAILASHGLSELAIASLAALGGGAGGSGGFGGGADFGAGSVSQFNQGHGSGAGSQHSISTSGSFGLHGGGFNDNLSGQFGMGGGGAGAGGGGGPTSFAGPGVAELGKGVPLQTLSKDMPLYIVEFKQGRTELYFMPDPSQGPAHRERIANGDLVIVEADRGKDLGTVVNDSLTVEQVQAFLAHQSELLQASQRGDISAEAASSDAAMYARLTRSIHPKRLYGKANATDTGLLLTKAQDEERALQLCRTKVSQRGLPMTVVAAEMQWDRRKLTFYYTASARVDFRDLVKELFRLYKTRIWMCHLAR
ncbi:hypothetical protein OC846_002620 [Tilletia horrida]|uniref:PSP1 C-terminal domain-containing protein n=1 Tax=Tilletia horrida TaxID=155126 RepID=A0AAN6GTA4_9BASI|nr:hypothetical protein OC846_002620 [Tilletia horrida]KAK0564715.1 hypothetical protein OC861_004132 [Tilletia horrida]